MFNKDEIPVLAILRGIGHKDIEPLAGILRDTGMKYVEITLNTDGAPDLIASMKQAGGKDMVVGAGTVIDLKGMDEALNAGAEFIVSPSVKEELVKTCVKNQIPVFPGAFTPTEVHLAWDLGATMVKLFPSGLIGPGYIAALKGPFDRIRIMAVGGVNEQNILRYFNHGADAVAVGAGVFRPNWLDEGKYDMISQKINQLLNSMKSD